MLEKYTKNSFAIKEAFENMRKVKKIKIYKKLFFSIWELMIIKNFQ